MATITDYLNPRTLRVIQDAFNAVGGTAVCICNEDGVPLSGDSAAGAARKGDSQDLYDVPVTVEGEVVARVVLALDDQVRRGSAVGRLETFVKLMVDVVTALCEGRAQLRTRMDELATLYRLTAEFTTHTDLQELLDLVARTVVEVLGAKACSIRLLDESGNELVIKAVANISAEYLNKGPILLSESKIDQEVIQERKTVYIADERSDPRVLYPAEARREGIVSALCAPMVYKEHVEGVIRVYTSDVHRFDRFEVALLGAIAGQAAAAIVNARLTAEAIQSASIKRALGMAAEVQRRMIPAKPPSAAGLEIATIYVPCFELGGDFYDFIEFPGENIALAVCDVVGKGVRASLLMSSIRASLRAHAVNVYEIAEVITKVNRDLCAGSHVSDFATMFYAVYEAPQRRLTYVNAGHTPPILVHGGAGRRLESGGPILGIDETAQWQAESLLLQGGDVFVAYTDGFSEAMNFDDETFGRQRVENAVLAAVQQGHDADGISKHVLWEVRRFAGLQTRFDDLTLVACKVL